MADKVAFELVSPASLLVSEEVDMVVLPAADGDLGVLPGHSPVIANIRPGTICIFNGNSVEKRLFVAGGFLEITEERCTVLAEEATDVSDIDQSTVQSQIRDLKEDVTHAKDDAERTKAEAALAVAEAKLQATAQPAYA